MIIIRPEQPQDEEALFQMYRRACGRLHEARLLDTLRENRRLFLSLAAWQENQAVGGVAFSSASLALPVPELTLAALAPLAVLPAQRRQGIGSTLVRLGLQRCRERQVDGVVVVGDPAWWGKFGFVAAAAYNWRGEPPIPAPFWLVQELRPDALPKTPSTIVLAPELREFLAAWQEVLILPADPAPVHREP
jgi:putative acetyltransferase